MRILAVILAAAVTAGPASAKVYTVPDVPHGINCIQDAIDQAVEDLTDPVSRDTVVVTAGVYDSVHTFVTAHWGTKTAIVSVADSITIRGVDRDDVVIDHTDADYGILCVDVGPATWIKSLTVTGGVGKGMRVPDDPDVGRMVSAICCIDDASPLIDRVTIEDAATGIISQLGASPTISRVLIARGGGNGIYISGSLAFSSAYVDGCTIVENFDRGIRVIDGGATIKNCSITHNGNNGIRAFGSVVDVSYCNVFWNDAGEGGSHEDYGGELGDLTGVAGNISTEPYYCDFTGSAGYDYRVCADSPNIDGGEGNSLIGAYGAGCTECVSPIRDVSWGSIKALYR